MRTHHDSFNFPPRMFRAASLSVSLLSEPTKACGPRKWASYFAQISSWQHCRYNHRPTYYLRVSLSEASDVNARYSRVIQNSSWPSNIHFACTSTKRIRKASWPNDRVSTSLLALVKGTYIPKQLLLPGAEATRH